MGPRTAISATSPRDPSRRLQRRRHRLGVRVVRVVDDADAVGVREALHPPRRDRRALEPGGALGGREPHDVSDGRRRERVRHHVLARHRQVHALGLRRPGTSTVNEAQPSVAQAHAGGADVGAGRHARRSPPCRGTATRSRPRPRRRRSARRRRRGRAPRPAPPRTRRSPPRIRRSPGGRRPRSSRPRRRAARPRTAARRRRRGARPSRRRAPPSSGGASRIVRGRPTSLLNDARLACVRIRVREHGRREVLRRGLAVRARDRAIDGRVGAPRARRPRAAAARRRSSARSTAGPGTSRAVAHERPPPRRRRTPPARTGRRPCARPASRRTAPPAAPAASRSPRDVTSTSAPIGSPPTARATSCERAPPHRPPRTRAQLLGRDGPVVERHRPVGELLARARVPCRRSRRRRPRRPHGRPARIAARRSGSTTNRPPPSWRRPWPGLDLRDDRERVLRTRVVARDHRRGPRWRSPPLPSGDAWRGRGRRRTRTRR